MNTSKTFRRLAAFAAATTVAGVVVPIAAAAGASAATPPAATGISSVTPATQYVQAATPGSPQYTVTLSPSGSTSATGVSYDIYSGPDSATGSPFAGHTCGSANEDGTYTCAIANVNTTAGTDHIHFYIPATAGADFVSSDPSADATLVKSGTATSFTLTPTSQSIATATCATYVLTAKDINGNPVVGTAFPVTVSQTVANTAGDPNLRFCTPNTTTFPADTLQKATAGTPGTTTTTYTATANSSNTSNGSTTGSTPGTVAFGVASDLAGTVNISAGNTAAATGTTAAITPATGTLTVDAGNTQAGTNNYTTNLANNNVAHTLTVSNKTVTTFPGATVTETVTVKNTAGDALGGVAVDYEITSGPDAVTTPQACTATTNGAGQTTCTFVAHAGGTNSDAFVAFVNQSTSATPTANADQGEPQDTATITINNPTITGGNRTNLTSSCDTTCKVPTTNTSEPVTFTLKDDSGNPIAGATITYTVTPSSGYTVTPASPLTTNSSGQATVTVTPTATPANDSQVQIVATLTSPAATNTATDTATVQYLTAGAVQTISLQPYTQDAAQGGKVTVTATALDGFGNPVNGATIQFSTSSSSRNNSTNNQGSLGSCVTGSAGTCNFSYTDNQGTVTGTTTTDTITATSSSVSQTATVHYYADTTAKTVTLTVTQYTESPGNIGEDCGNTTTTQRTVQTSAAGGDITPVCVTVTNAAGNTLQGEPVTFTSSGVGVFVDPDTGATSTTVTVPVDDSGSQTDQPNGSDVNYAKVYVRSGSAGTQTITATADSVSATGTVTYTNSEFTSLTPERLVDTRSGQGGVNTGPLAPNTAYTFDLSKTDVPTDAAAYSFNITAINPTAAGNLRIGPADDGTPSTSLVNYQQGVTTANAIIVPNNGEGSFTLYSAGASADVAIDVSGYFLQPTNQCDAEFFSAKLAPRQVCDENPTFRSDLNGTPTRVADTRTSTGGGTVAANTSRSFTIPTTDVPAGAKAVAINVTAIGPAGAGNLRIYPDGASVPTTSNINYIPGVDKAAFDVVPLPADGKIDVFSAGSAVNVAVDVFGYFAGADDPNGSAESSLVTQTPTRAYDSRNGAGELTANVPRDIQITGAGAVNGVGGVPADAQAVLISLTGIHAADSTGVGNLRVYPTGASTPTVSTLNYVSKTTDVANFALVPIGSNGKITLYSAGSNEDVAVDILGYLPAGS